MSDVEVWAVVSQELLKWVMLLLGMRTLIPLGDYFRHKMKLERAIDDESMKGAVNAMRFVQHVRHRLSDDDEYTAAAIRDDFYAFIGRSEK